MKNYRIMKIIVLIVAVILTIFFGIGKISKFNSSDNTEIKGLLEYFWKAAGNEMDYLVKEYNQTAEVDNYTITLESAVFSDETETAYARFRVSQKDAVVKADMYSDDNMWKDFGEDRRFSLWVNADIGQEGKFYGTYDGADLIIYCSFQYFCDEIEDTHEIYLADKKTGKTTYENCAAKFQLEPSSPSLEIKCSTTRTIHISSVAVKISSEVDLYPRTIEICYKNGEKYEILNTTDGEEEKDNILSYSSLENMKYTEIVLSPYLIDIEQVEAVIYNGEKYKIEEK